MLYKETVPLTAWVWGLIVLVLVLLLGSLIAIVLSDPSQSDLLGFVIAGAVSIGVAFVAWNYRAIEIRLSRKAFEARYGIFNKTVIPVSEIESCKSTNASFGRYFGIGVRLGRDGTWAYTAFFGSAVEIRRRSHKPFVVSSKRPQDLCQSINKALLKKKR